MIDYYAPPEKLDELGQFDGSVYVDRTNGELAAKCDQEAANFLAINLAHEIVTGEKSVEEARQAYAEAMVMAEMDEPPETTQSLQFEVAEGDERDPDETIITDELKQQVQERMEGG